MLEMSRILDTPQILLYACPNCYLFKNEKKKRLDIVRTREQEESNTIHKQRENSYLEL